MSRYLPHERTKSRGNVGCPEEAAVDKSQVVVGNPGREDGGDTDVVTGELV